MYLGGGELHLITPTATYPDITFILQMGKLRHEPAKPCAYGKYLSQDSFKSLTLRPKPFPPPSARQASFLPILGNVNKSFQDRAGLGRPLSDLLFRPLQMLSASQATAHMALAQPSKLGHRAFPLASGMRTKVRDPQAGLAAELWCPVTQAVQRGGVSGVILGRAHDGPSIFSNTRFPWLR